MLEIQNGPPPARPFHARRYPFEKLEIGEWFFVPNKTGKSLYSHVSNVGKKLGRVFSTTQVYMREGPEGWESCTEDEPGAVIGVCIRRLE
jgi:hypothetical protein